jgi:hypothetical protein
VAEKKKIAILGWGSLIWDVEDNREFNQLHEEWKCDGPVLGLEFSRKSCTRAGALTLVIDPKHGAPCTVAWALSTRPDLAEAIEDLRLREKTSAKKIGRFPTDESQRGLGKGDAALGAIAAWTTEKRLDAVLWTALTGDFDAVPERDFLREAVKYVQELNPQGKAKAAEYVWRAPDFVRTPLREALQKEPWFAPPK